MQQAIEQYFQGKVVAITGAAGSVGEELVRQLLAMDVAGVRALDNDENGLFHIEKKFGGDPRFHAYRCDIASSERTRRVFDGTNAVFHAAALKHVPICERAPTASVDVNVTGTINVMEAAIDAGVERVVFTSSDKAVNPTNVMGASKLLAERIACSLDRSKNNTIISCTRFGNVAGSRGSVIPHFAEQILARKPITLTSPEMTRFFMTLDDSVRLIIESMIHSRGGETFVTKMVTMRIADLATAIAAELAPSVGMEPDQYPIEIIGPRPGEKLYEELTTDEEEPRTYEFDNYLVVQPVAMRHELGDTIAYDLLGQAPRSTKPYNSRFETPLSVAEVREYLRTHELLPDVGQNQPHLRAANAA